MLPTPPIESIIYEDDRLYVCSAIQPITNGHVLVVWKDDVTDIHNLSDEEYDYLMAVVDVVRDMQLTVLGVDKVYLLYMDEARHVHWHLVPRYNEEGFDVFSHNPLVVSDFPLISKFKEAFIARYRERFGTL